MTSDWQFANEFFINEMSADKNTDLCNQPDLIIDTDENLSWASEELVILKNSFFESLDTHALELFNAWSNKSEHCSLKVSTYFQAYADQLHSYRGRNCTLVEIGVMEGGSLLAWKEWLGPGARVIGIDINPEAKELEKEGIEIIIGNQADPTFWEVFLKENNDIDIIIDDGGHQYFQQALTFFCILCHAKRKIQFIVEDTSTSFFSNFLEQNEENFVSLMKQVIDNLNLKQIFSKKGLSNWRNDIDLQIVKEYQKIQSLCFYSGLISMKIDPLKGLVPLYLYNVNRRTKKEDLRHSGCITGVKFTWPDPIQPRDVLFKGLVESKNKLFVDVRKKTK